MSIDNNLWCTRIDYFSDTKYRVSVTNNTAIDFELKQRGELAIIDVSKISKIFWYLPSSTRNMTEKIHLSTAICKSVENKTFEICATDWHKT